MALRIAPRSAAGAAAPTQTQTGTDATEQGPSQGRHIGTLRLRGEPRESRGVRWASDVVDNSNMNRKKSKVCCIYHKPHPVGESSSESSSASSSSSDSESDSEPDNSKARLGGKAADRQRAQRRHTHHSEHDHDCGNESSASDDDGPDDSRRRRNPNPSQQHRIATSRRTRSPNAYEKMKTKKKGGSRTVTVLQDSAG